MNAEQQQQPTGGWQLKIWVYEDSESQRFREILEILRDSTRFLRDSESSFPQNSARGATSPWPSFSTEVCTMLRSGRSSVLACSIQLIETYSDKILARVYEDSGELPTPATDSIPIGNNLSALSINGLASSCGYLKMIGQHTPNGFYSIMGLTRMESVYCDFTKPTGNAGFKKFIGFVDVKTAPVYFYVQRDSYFETDEEQPIPFGVARVNEGNAMDLTTGIFTTPRPGIYFFSFAGVAYLKSSSFAYFYSYLYLNGR
ncbi:hypothetical protein DAPPUDRAFT_115465 [Daphnia pulex]|uniref:C1q domain-containing protein n=1 Tax=Daphnia pulex TaxID=6669 RepID=E9HLF6_DAPPU|nr:hypothetical protein DAPPUDRAFT_115465 [Daphnia pulex]|eukprot:EFX67442.1 hypothetical protein DAPPUDRAFT_115465 [Daphnia pulex]